MPRQPTSLRTMTHQEVSMGAMSLPGASRQHWLSCSSTCANLHLSEASLPKLGEGRHPSGVLQGGWQAVSAPEEPHGACNLAANLLLSLCCAQQRRQRPPLQRHPRLPGDGGKPVMQPALQPAEGRCRPQTLSPCGWMPCSSCSWRAQLWVRCCTMPSAC